MVAESKTVEYKREYTDDIKKTVIAFANSDGGEIFIGIEDDGTIRGLYDPNDVMLRVTNAIRDSIHPDVTLFVETGVEMTAGKSIVVVKVQRGTARPYYLSGKGIRTEGVFVRQGASTVPATDAAILSMIRETSGDSYEEARSLIQQLTFRETAAYFEKRGVAFGDAQKKTLRLIGEDGTYTNLALLLSEQCTHTIKLAVFEGEEKTIFRERREFSGSILHQLEEAYDFIDRFNRTLAEFRGLERIDKRDYPPEAIREALLNAVVHRDYAFSGSTLINIFEDRMEFITIGGLVKGISLEDILLGVSILRNRYLANIFYRLKLIEAYGIGIPRIIGSYEDTVVKPRVEATNNAFKITLPNMNIPSASLTAKQNPRINEREKQVLALFQKKDSIARSDVETALNVSQATAVVLLREMVAKGLLKKVGAGKLQKYVLDEKNQ